MVWEQPDQEPGVARASSSKDSLQMIISELQTESPTIHSDMFPTKNKPPCKCEDSNEVAEQWPS